MRLGPIFDNRKPRQSSLEFDVVLMFGLLHYSADISAVATLSRPMTKGVCLIETQLDPELPEEIEWGGRESKKQIKGCCAPVVCHRILPHTKSTITNSLFRKSGVKQTG